MPQWLGASANADSLALFVATVISISALPVIAKVLMDLNLYRTDLGMIVIAAAVIDDLTGWAIFAGLLSTMGSREFGLVQIISGTTVCRPDFSVGRPLISWALLRLRPMPVGQVAY